MEGLTAAGSTVLAALITAGFALILAIVNLIAGRKGRRSDYADHITESSDRMMERMDKEIARVERKCSACEAQLQSTEERLDAAEQRERGLEQRSRRSDAALRALMGVLDLLPPTDSDMVNRTRDEAIALARELLT